MAGFRNMELLWVIGVVCLIYVKNGDFAQSKSNALEPNSDSKELNETIAELKKSGVTLAMMEKFEKANAASENITSSFIAHQLKTLSANKPLTDEERKKLARSMLQGVRRWFVGLEVGLPLMSKFAHLVEKYNSSNLELSLHINYFLSTTSPLGNKTHNMIVDTMRETGVKKSEIVDAVQPETLGYMGNSELAQELIGLILSNDGNNE